VFDKILSCIKRGGFHKKQNVSYRGVTCQKSWKL